MKLLLLLVALIAPSIAFAEGSAPAPAGNPILSFLPLVAVFVVFYFFMIRPQQKKQREFQNTLSQLKVGDKVSTVGGIIGTIKAISEDKGTMTLTIGQNMDIEVYKKAISEVLKSEALKA